jgi:lipopolysaccharide biosynthesis protein
MRSCRMVRGSGSEKDHFGKMTSITNDNQLRKNSDQSELLRYIAFYLPQFHPTPYNDEWWGKGFTEWTNVVRARPRFRGHYQPHLPADLGFCDLRVPEVRHAQAELARTYGIHGFCYYHYWFTGKRVLEHPLREVLRLGEPDFPFCICWANENWTRAWDGNSGNVLLEQRYSPEDDINHIQSCIPMLEDRRYIRVEDKPLLLIYRKELLPEPERTIERWRREALRAGLGDLFLVNVQSNYVRFPQDSTKEGFDAAVRFQPNIYSFHAPKFIRGIRALRSLRYNDRVYTYKSLYEKWKAAALPGYRNFDCVTPMWDNSARRAKKALMIKDSTPQLYEAWLRDATFRATPDRDGRRWVFINAWNEWGEGCHLEPCQRWGRAYLDATRRVYEEAEQAFRAVTNPEVDVLKLRGLRSPQGT